MKQVEYIAEIQDDGDLSLPESIRQRLGLNPSTRVRVLLVVPEASQMAGYDDPWSLFHHMGEDAAEGNLHEAATFHDRYLNK